MQDTARPSCFWQNPAPATLEAAMLCTLAYADLFDYPMTAGEVHRYLVGFEVDLPGVEAVLNNGHAPGQIARRGEYFTLSGREQIVEIRTERARAAAELWPEAIVQARAMAGMPFVQMVAVTGALAVDNAQAGDDIDYLIVTAPDRLWLCRALIIQFVVKPAARRGTTLCPNYFLSERALDCFEHNLFTAHEIVQMVPVAGHDTYRRLCHLNRWAARFLPNAYNRPRAMNGSAEQGVSLFLATEPLLRSRAGGWLERWERERKIGRLDRQRQRGTEASFTVDWCKGHFESHEAVVRRALFQRLAALDPGGAMADGAASNSVAAGGGAA